jgi:hypothetical protein
LPHWKHIRGTDGIFSFPQPYDSSSGCQL